MSSELSIWDIIIFLVVWEALFFRQENERAQRNKLKLNHSYAFAYSGQTKLFSYT